MTVDCLVGINDESALLNVIQHNKLLLIAKKC